MKQIIPFRNASIRVRLSLLMAVNTGMALLLAGIGLFGYEDIQQRETATRELSAEAAIVAGNSTAALSFADERAATETLAALRGDSRLVEAVLYDRNNRPFAHYSRAREAHSITPIPEREGVFFENGSWLAYRPIVLGGERIGSILLKSTSGVQARLRRYIGILCLVLSISLLLALLLGARMQRTIAEPIAELSAIARRVSRDHNDAGDYGVRAALSAGGEIGVLIDSFNAMLAQIQARDESLRESEERYALAARGANDGLWDWKLSTGKVYFSSRWRQMLGYSSHDQWSDPDEWFSRVHPADLPRVSEDIALHREGKTSELVSEYRMRHRNGGFIWMLTRGIAVRNVDGTAIRMAGSQTDVTEGKIGDALTGLPNRLYLVDKLESCLDESGRTGHPFALLYLDLDRFELINDSLGHAAGDELLTGVAGRLRSSVRIAERAAGVRQSVIARLGGDEFAILLIGVPDAAAAALVADRVVRELDFPFSVEGRQVFATVSIGIALSSAENSPEEILRNADTAMYHAKARGKGRFEVFDEGMRERAVARLEIESGLRRAIGSGQLVLYYQPQIALGSRQVIGYEALVRWLHPERGMVSPCEFIPFAEESDLIVHLGRWVLREACSQMAKWHKTLASDPPLTVSVNVSTRQLSDPRFIEDVEVILTETGLNPEFLKLEMTESSIMRNPETTMDTLRRLKAQGIGLEIDDFGTGYSSLSYLQKLPFDTVKVDRSFVRDLGDSGESFEIVRAIIDLARSLEMRVVAEGVETVDQLRKLDELGCNYAQGFYFSKPTSPQATLEGALNLLAIT